MPAPDLVLNAGALSPSLEERRKEREHRLHRLNTRTIPVLRLLGGNLVVLAVILHNAWIFGAIDWGRILAFTAFVEVYALVSWGIILSGYRPGARVDLGLVFLVLDLFVLAVAVRLTGANESWIFWIFLFRVVDQTTTHFRRAFAFTILGTAAYLGVVLWAVAAGAVVSWPAESAKLIFLVLGGTYMSLTARTAERVRRQLADAMRMARQSVEELRAQSRELDRAREQAEAGSRAKSAFLSRVSHELRTPMNAILGFAQLLEMEKDLNDDQQVYVGEIMEGGRHLLDVINEVMEIARVETGALAQDLEPVAIGEALDEVLERAMPAADRRDISLTRVTDVEGVWVAGNARKVRQVIDNLVSNAIKYNSSPGQVEVAVATSSDRVRVSITDTGPGIPADQVEQAFVPFDRLGAEQHESEGSGLGLPLARSLVRAMGGELGVDTSPGNGSTFWFELLRTEPTPPPAPEPEVEPHASAAVGPGENALVLYIDDKPENVLLVRRILSRRPGLRLISESRGIAGLEAVKARRPHLILLDLELPDISGTEVMRRLRADPHTRGIPVVVVSAEASSRSVERLLEEGARAYFTMPYDVAALLDTLDELLHAVPTRKSEPRDLEPGLD